MTGGTTSWTLRFLGVGGAQSPELGSASGAVEVDGRPILMIDCGAEALQAYLRQYGEAPTAVYVTHAHLDHVGGMERLFHRIWFDAEWRGRVRLIMHAALVPLVQQRIADYPEVLAEGGVNYWDGFRLVPVSSSFWLEDWRFEVFATRHHAPMTSFGVALPGSFVWTGDTRPIPEMLAAHAGRGELVAHDCALGGNPSHTGLDDLAREYPEELRQRLVLYHYATEADAEAMRTAGYRVARNGEAFALARPARSAGAGEGNA